MLLDVCKASTSGLKDARGGEGTVWTCCSAMASASIVAAEQGVLRKVDQQLDMPKSCVAGAWLSSGSNNRPRTRTKLAF